MPRDILLADGRSVEVDCLSCALTSGLITPTGGVIFESSNFHVHQMLHTQLEDLSLSHLSVIFIVSMSLPKKNRVNICR